MVCKAPFSTTILLAKILVRASFSTLHFAGYNEETVIWAIGIAFANLFNVKILVPPKDGWIHEVSLSPTPLDTPWLRALSLGACWDILPARLYQALGIPDPALLPTPCTASPCHFWCPPLSPRAPATEWFTVYQECEKRKGRERETLMGPLPAPHIFSSQIRHREEKEKWSREWECYQAVFLSWLPLCLA